MSKKHKLFSLAILFVLAGSVVSGCASQSGLAMAPMDGMPHDVQTAPTLVREAYQFAVANPEVMTQIPCYCGCGAMGHTSNYACYVSGVAADGMISYDTHALGCSICVDITQDTMRLLKEGKSIPEIRATIDSTYSQYGPSNMP